MNATIYIEGGSSGPDSKEMQVRCREGFRKLLEKCGFQGRMPRLSACGGRDAVFSDFSTAHANRSTRHYVAMWLDSEDPVKDIEKAWDHLGNVKVQQSLEEATRDCTSPYSKGKQSYALLGMLAPAELARCLPSFVRVRRILDEKLQAPSPP